MDFYNPKTYQLRNGFPEEILESLSKTITPLGILEPLIVHRSKKHANKLEIIAGERRFRGFLMKMAINKNNMGYFCIPFHDRPQMHIMLDKLNLD